MLKKDIDWHIAVCSRERYICQGCGTDFSADYYFDFTTGLNWAVCGHHVKSKKAYPKLRYVVDNGKCTCLDCHVKHHKGLIQYCSNHLVEV